MPPNVAVIFTSTEADLPAVLDAWLDSAALATTWVREVDELMALALRGHPRIAILDGRTDPRAAAQACARLKADSYTGVVPAVILTCVGESAMDMCFASGADEVLHDAMSVDELRNRLLLALQRSDRDVQVHPSTRLPGTAAIETELARRIASGRTFAVCYADLDHFKEFNDRYSYYDGDRVIRLLAKILHDVVKGICGENGFIGHIGGDDFLFVIPATEVSETCEEVVTVFDLLVPYQYSEPDRRAGYFFGKDRRGQLHRVPLMTLSIGVVTNERRLFTSPAQVSELATEMKGFAKTLPGSVFTVDRRQNLLTSAEATPVQPHQALSSIEEL